MSDEIVQVRGLLSFARDGGWRLEFYWLGTLGSLAAWGTNIIIRAGLCRINLSLLSLCHFVTLQVLISESLPLEKSLMSSFETTEYGWS
jgi:hypothetical protein